MRDGSRRREFEPRLASLTNKIFSGYDVRFVLEGVMVTHADLCDLRGSADLDYAPEGFKARLTFRPQPEG